MGLISSLFDEWTIWHNLLGASSIINIIVFGFNYTL